MSITIPLPPEIEHELRVRASASGQDIVTIVLEAIKEKLSAPPGRTFDDIFAEWRQDVKESGVSDDELNMLFEQAREEVWQQKR